MDLRMHLSVLWRWRIVVACGLALALVLTFFSFFRVSLAHGVTYRQGKTWKSSEQLLFTQQNQIFNASGNGNPAWLITLTSLYSQIANSAVIRARVLPGGQATAASGDFSVSPVFDSTGQSLLPIIQFDGTGSTPQQAVRVARRATTAFLSYLAQNSAPIAKRNRVETKVLSTATVAGAKVATGRKLTIPIIVFLVVLIGTIGLTYLLENLFPRTAPAAGEGTSEPILDSQNGTDTTIAPADPPEPEPVLESQNGADATIEPADAPERAPARSRTAEKTRAK
jgi:capsular polysaccharide biosynthesis protein